VSFASDDDTDLRHHLEALQRAASRSQSFAARDVASDVELDLRWYVVQGRVRLAARKLHDAGYFQFVPEEIIRVGAHKTRRPINVPLFGIYLFVRLDLRVHNWRRLLDIEGVGKVLCSGEGEAAQPVEVPAEFVDRLIATGPLDRGKIQQLQLAAAKSRRQGPAAGDRVRIVDSVLGEQIGKVEGVDERGRASVLIRIMGRLVPVILSTSLLEPASEREFPVGSGDRLRPRATP
jgi:transcription antitermination factor NusG